MSLDISERCLYREKVCDNVITAPDPIVISDCFYFASFARKKKNMQRQAISENCASLCLVDILITMKWEGDTHGTYDVFLSVVGFRRSSDRKIPLPETAR